MNIIKEQKGTSLPELLVVIAIMAIMAVALMPGYLSNKRAKAVNFAKIQIINDMKYVQNSTLSGMKIPGNGVSKGGFGINIVKGNNYFIIFGDQDSSKQYDASKDGLVEKVFLESGTYISDLEECSSRSCNNINGDYTRMNYVCIPPYGNGFINALGADREVVVRITLSSVDGKVQNSFIISSTGYTS